MTSVRLAGALVVALALPTLVAGCGGARPAGAAASRPRIVGGWKTACIAANPDQGAILDYAITETRWAIDYILFGEPRCTSRFLTIHIEGPYQVGAPSAVVPGAFDADFGFATKTLTPHVDEAAEFLASADGCGRAGFAAGVTTDISAAGCAGLLLRPIAACETDFDLVKLDGDELRFGARPDDNDMCTAARRPTALEPVSNRRK